MGQYFKKIVGERVYLSPLDPEDAPLFAGWLADLEVTKFMLGSPWVLGVVSEKEFLTKMAQGQNHFGIVEKATDQLLGACGFDGIDNIQGTAEVGIFLGGPSTWGRGYGTEAMTLLLDFGFHVRNYHNVLLKVKAFNTRAIRSYEKTGFRKIGVRREAFRNGSTYGDEILMDILATEFRAGRLEKELTR